ncbi:MAG: type IV toxin-antitoxin system AbiEi family antitoxin domain-containing protein [Firmicutes bacterium]|nr:type IV toxin-antitoxin system AbiEi family antitoxin domain-containing protein [Bacillota bacterium]
MSYMEKLIKIIEESDGLICTKDIVAEGIPKIYLSQLVEKGKLERIAYGVYLTPDALADKMYYLQRRKPAIVFSHDTALFLHDLSDRDPLIYSVTVPIGYNTKNIKDEGLIVFSIRKELYEVGLTTLTTPFGRSVKAYNMERTVCDMIRSRSKMDISILTDALKRYAKRMDKNIPKLMEYAETFKVTKLLRNYMEVLL